MADNNNKQNFMQLGLSFLLFLTVATVLSLFEIEEKPTLKRKKNAAKMKNQYEVSASSSLALLVRPAPHSIGRPETTIDQEEDEEEEEQSLEEDQDSSLVAEHQGLLPEDKYDLYSNSFCLNRTPGSRRGSIGYDVRSQESEELKEMVRFLEQELDKQRSYVNSEKQAKVFVENQFKAESRIRCEAEEMLRLQSVEHEKQIHSLEAQLTSERRKAQILQEKLHIIEAKLTFRSRQSVEPVVHEGSI